MMFKIGSLFLLDEHGPKVQWYSDETPISRDLGVSNGIDPWVYSGSMIPTSGQEVALTMTDGTPAELMVSTQPPQTWDGQSLRLSARIAQLRAQGVFIEGMQGHAEWAARQNPFANPLPLSTADVQQVMAIQRIETKLDEALVLLRSLDSLARL